MNDKKRLTIYVNENLRNRLQKYAKSEKRSVTSSIEIILENYLDKKGKDDRKL